MASRKTKPLTRRQFIANSALAAVGLGISSRAAPLFAAQTGQKRLVMMGGRRTAGFANHGRSDTELTGLVDAGLAGQNPVTLERFPWLAEELPSVNKWVLKGYQADIDAQQQYTGMLYEERGRGFVNRRGLFTTATADKKIGIMGNLADDAVLKGFIKTDDWNDFQVVARGNQLVHLINGHVMSMFIDDDKDARKMGGLIGIQLHVTPGPMKIEVRNIRIKSL